MGKEDGEGQGFRTLAEAEEAYAKLQTKLGKQGEELGQLRQGMTEAQKTLQGYQAWAQTAAPVVDWYSKNEAELKRRWSAFENGGGAAPANGGHANGGSAAAAGQAAVAQAGAIAQQDPSFQWLTPQEQQALVGKIAQNLLEQHLAPWTQTFSKQAQDFATKAQQSLQAQMKAYQDVLWRSMERLHPKEKIDELRKWHDQALAFADPSKMDPMSHANDWMSMQNENATLKARIEEFEKKSLERDRAAASPAVMGGAPPESAASAGAASRPADKADRMNRVMDAVRQEHGPEGMTQLFGSGSRLAS